MIDAPPAIPVDLGQSQDPKVASHLPMEEQADGSLLIDLKPLEDKDRVEECFETDPNPLENGIVVCRVVTTDQRLGLVQNVTAADVIFASAIPRAKFRLSEDATGEINGTAPSVGGFNAQGAEVRVRIGF